MIENRTLGSKIFDVINVIIMIICALLCIVPVWYVICVSLSSKEAVNAGLVSFWPVGFNLFSYQKILGESDFFRSFWVSIQRVLLGTGVSMFCILLAAYPLSRTSKQFPKRSIFMWILVFCMLFNGGTVPWYITMKGYGLVDSIWGLVLGMGLNVYNLILAVNFFKNLPAELEEAALVDGAEPWKCLVSIFIPLAKAGDSDHRIVYHRTVLERVLPGNGTECKAVQLSAADVYSAAGCYIMIFQR